MKNVKNSARSRMNQKVSELTKRRKTKVASTKRKRLFSISGFIPTFPTRAELQQELQYWSDLDPLRLEDLAVA